MPSSAPIADGEMPLAAASFLKPASHASKPAGSRQVGASREGSHWRQTIKPKKRIIDRMKTIPAEKQEGLFLGTALAQDCGQRSREERRHLRPISFKGSTVPSLAWMILYLNRTLVRCPPAPRVHGANANVNCRGFFHVA